MNQEKINEIVELIKNNDETKKAFAILDEVSDFLQKDKKFFNFAGKQAQKNYVSPMEMIMLAHDYLNNTGIYAKWIKKEKDAKAKKVATTKKVKDATVTVIDKVLEKRLKSLDISEASQAELKEYIDAFKIKGTIVPIAAQESLITISEEDQMRALIEKHVKKHTKVTKVAKKVIKEESTIDNQVSLFDEGAL